VKIAVQTAADGNLNFGGLYCKYILDESSNKVDADNDPSWWDEESCLVAIDLGFDEGGSGDDLLVSVQLGIIKQAKKLKKSWSKRLPEGLPFFHSKDFGNYEGGIFTKANLKRSERSKLLGDLCGFIHDRLIAGITVRISISKYDRLTTQTFRSRHGTAYGFAVNMALMGAYAVCQELGIKPEFNILIEDGHRNSTQVSNILAGLRDLPDRLRELFKDKIMYDLRILTAGLGGKADHPILQCADMLAYAEWQGISNSDPEIWNALRRNPRYKMLRALCDDELITEFVSEGVRYTNLGKKWKAVKKREAKQRISGIQPGDDDDTAGRSQLGEDGYGSGEART